MKKGQVVDDAAPHDHVTRWSWWLALCFCLAGLALSILLEQIHFKTHTDPGFHSFCAIDRTVNCDIVARSPYAVLGGVPVAAWGIFGYLIAAGVFLWGARSRQPLLVTGCGLYLALALTAVSAAFGAVSAFLVAAVCLLCLGTYAVNLLLVVCMLFAARGVGLRAAFAEPLRVPCEPSAYWCCSAAARSGSSPATPRTGLSNQRLAGLGPRLPLCPLASSLAADILSVRQIRC
jgi:uncharacterized membrane protein